MIYLFIAISLFCLNGYADDQLPTLNKGEIQISDTLKDKIEKSTFKNMKPMSNEHFPSEVLELFKNDKDAAPGLIFGDFNGDSKKDACLLLRSNNQIVAVAVISKNDSFELVEVDRWTADRQAPLERTYLSLLDKKKVNFNGKEVSKKRDLIQIETYLGAVKALYIFDSKAYQYKGLVP